MFHPQDNARLASETAQTQAVTLLARVSELQAEVLSGNTAATEEMVWGSAGNWS